MAAGLHWTVLGMTADPEGRVPMVRLRLGGIAQGCEHVHPTREEAEACPWEPSMAPGTPYAGIVRQVRADDGRRRRGSDQLAMPWGGHRLRQRAEHRRAA